MTLDYIVRVTLLVILVESGKTEDPKPHETPSPMRPYSTVLGSWYCPSVHSVQQPIVSAFFPQIITGTQGKILIQLFYTN